MKQILLIITMVIFLSACADKNAHDTKQDKYKDMVADTIRYNVSIMPIEDYEIESISRLDKDKLVNSLFESIYSHQAEVYDYTKGTKLTIDDVKTREIEDPRFSRDLISVLQFTETWSYNSATQEFTKKVLSVHIAYAVFDDENNFVANRAGIVVKMN